MNIYLSCARKYVLMERIFDKTSAAPRLQACSEVDREGQNEINGGYNITNTGKKVSGIRRVTRVNIKAELNAPPPTVALAMSVNVMRSYGIPVNEQVEWIVPDFADDKLWSFIGGQTAWDMCCDYPGGFRRMEVGKINDVEKAYPYTFLRDHKIIPKYEIEDNKRERRSARLRRLRKEARSRRREEEAEAKRQALLNDLMSQPTTYQPIGTIGSEELTPPHGIVNPNLVKTVKPGESSRPDDDLEDEPDTWRPGEED